MPYELRPYQEEAVASALTELRSVDSALLELATGTGKSVIAATVAARWKDVAHQYGLPERVLWLAQRDELILQACDHIYMATGEEAALEKGESRIGGSTTLYGRRCVVSSVQTMLVDERRNFFGEHEFGLVICDEAHHAVAEGHTKVIGHFSGAKLLGMTATVDRADGVSLSKAFRVPAYQYNILDGMRDGYLCPITQSFIEDISLDFSGVRTAGGDLSASDLDEIVRQEEPLHKIVSSTVQMAGDRQTIVFCPSVPSSDAVASLLCRYDRRAVAISGKTPEEERRKIIDDYRDGKYQYLVNCMVLTEGFDAPATACVVIARPTASRALYAQMIGRGLRGGPKCPVPGKTDLLVIDLVGASKLKLVHSSHLLSGALNEDVADEINRRMESGVRANGSVDVMSILEAACAEADKICADRRKEIIAESRVKSKQVDPFLIMADDLELESTATVDGWWKDAPANEMQKALLERSGIKPEEWITYEKASQLLKALRRRRDEGTCSLKQGKLLRARGIDPHSSFEQAHAILDHFSRREGGLSFTREDAIRVAMTKRRGGKLFEYRELRNMPRYYIPKGSPFSAERRGSNDPRNTEARENVYPSSVHVTDNGRVHAVWSIGKTVFDLDVAASAVYDLRERRWLAPRNKEA